jgi:tetratricopeptide (TPR) repeat protein
MTARAELGTLEASGLIAIAALQPELEYLFRHALVQDAAYGSLLKQDRRTLHRAAAETLLALYPDRKSELAAVVAMHFEQAGDAARATELLVLAGEHTLERFAHREAVAFFNRAVALADDSQRELRLRAAIGGAKAGWTYNQPGTDIERLERALAGADRTDRQLLADAYFWIAFLRQQRGEVPESSPPLKDALNRVAEIGAALGDPHAGALPRAFMGSYLAFTGRLREGAREMSEALDAIEAKADPLSTAMVCGFLTMTYARLGEFANAEETLARSKRLSDAGGDAISRVDVLIAGAAIKLERGDFDAASALSLECATRAEALGANACVVASSALFGTARLAKEDARTAEALLEHASELALVTNMAPMRTAIQGLLGSVRARLGDMPAGVAGWNDALAGARAMSDRFGEAYTLWGRARTYAREPAPDWTAVFSDLDKAIELFRAMETRPALARALRDRANALRSAGRAAEASSEDRESQELGRELGLQDLL